MSEPVPTPEADPLLGKVFDERYRIEAPLGQGGIGRVYRARHLILGRMVALKVLLAQYANLPTLRKRFKREAEALAALSHPNIVTVTDFGVAESTPYLVMELLAGRDLSALIESEVVEPKRALGMVRQMLRALAHAHSQGLVHRDLKPHNVFLRDLEDETDHIEVLDFGLARFVDESRGAAKLTGSGVLIGTPAYMAPEQASGETADSSADVYSAAIVAFELLSGRRPFESDDPGQVMRAHLMETPPTLAEADPGLSVSSGFQEWLSKALDKRPRHRFGDAREMLAALEELGDEPVKRISERPPLDRPMRRVAPTQATKRNAPAVQAPTSATSDSGPIKLPVRRNRMLVWALAFGVLGSVFGAGVVVWWASGHPHREASTNAADPVPTQTAGPRTQATPTDLLGTELPEPLSAVHTQLQAGERPPPAAWSALSDFQHANPTDARPHLLLAHGHVLDGRHRLAVAEYRQAYRLNPAARGDPPMLNDLLDRVERGESNEVAAQALVELFGAQARSEAERRREATSDEQARARLTDLETRLRDADR